ncbi:MAG: hypothetical protein HY787_01485 [Deltaproteobacteria bacterium]|nr:hypothetical protein [Deltaproteobacteria bacterium]
MTQAIRVERDIPMKMRDGITLRADIFRPDDREKHPAIIVRTPYNKTRSGASDFLFPGGCRLCRVCPGGPGYAGPVCLGGRIFPRTVGRPGRV